MSKAIARGSGQRSKARAPARGKGPRGRARAAGARRFPTRFAG